MTPQYNSQPYSLLLLGSQMALGGAQRVLLDQANWFHQRGHTVVAAFFHDRDGLGQEWQKQYPFPVINLNAWRPRGNILNPLRLVAGLIRLHALIRKGRFQVIETFTHHSNLLGLPIAWAARVPVRVASHHGVIEGLSPQLTRLHTLLINSYITHCLITVSEGIEAAAVREGIRANKIVIIKNGVKPFDDMPLTNEERASTLAELGITPEKNVVLSVGRLTSQKGHIYLLGCIPLVLEQFPNVVFLFAGDGPLRTVLEENAARLGIETAMRFLGKRTDIPKLLRLADIFVLPSLQEGLAIALLEAMSAGLPVIATQISGVDEVITHGQTGLLVPPADPQALGEAILYLLQNPKIRVDLGAAGKALIRNHYSLEHMCTRYEALFCDLLEVRK